MVDTVSHVAIGGKIGVLWEGNSCLVWGISSRNMCGRDILHRLILTALARQERTLCSPNPQSPS